MKKVWLMILSALLAVGMVACNKKSDETKAAEERAAQPQASQGGASSGPQDPAGAVDARKNSPDADDIELGKSIDANKKVVDSTDDFSPKDTIYASVRTDGAAANAKVTARWTYGDSGQLVKEDSRTVPAGGAAWTEFHISKPSGFPAGKYKVTILVNGDDKGSKDFEIK